MSWPNKLLCNSASRLEFHLGDGHGLHTFFFVCWYRMISNKHLQKASLRIHNVCVGIEQIIWYNIFSVSQHFVFRTRVNFSEIGEYV